MPDSTSPLSEPSLAPTPPALINGLGGSAGFGEHVMPRSDDGSSAFIDVSSVFESGLNFFGTVYTGIYINNNGNITFDAPSGTYDPPPLGANVARPIIAAFHADVSTYEGEITPSEGGTSTGSNLVYWDLDAAADRMTITWDDVTEYPDGTTPNAFQLSLVDLGSGNFGVEFRYEDIRWTHGNARAGYSADDGVHFYELPESGTSRMLDLETTDFGFGSGIFTFDVVNEPNEAPTGLSLSNGTIDENTAFNATVGTLSTTDPNASDRFVYSLVDGVGATDNGAFSIVGNALRLDAPADFESQQSYSVLIRSTDPFGLSVEQVFQIAVNDLATHVVVGTDADEAFAASNEPDTIHAGGGRDTITAALGDLADGETLDGEDGDDAFVLTGGEAGQAIVLTLDDANQLTSLSGSVLSGLTLAGFEHIDLSGFAGAAIVTGNAAANALTGAAGGNRLDGGGGADTLRGGAGNDVFIVNHLGDEVIESSTGGGIDRVESSVTFSLGDNLEQLALTGNGAIDGSGNALANTLLGNGGDNRLSGAAGDDTVDGGAGIDTVVAQGDVDFLLTDGQLSGLGTDNLANIERADLTGGDGDNRLDAATYSHGAVVLSGGAGDDTLIGPALGGNLASTASNFSGGVGDDTLTGGAGIDRIVESGDVDFSLGNGQLTGLGSDRFSGIELAELTGGASGNRIDVSGFGGTLTVLDGGFGNDTLVGGAAQDWVRTYGAYSISLRDAVLVSGAQDTLVAIDSAMLHGGQGSNLLDASDFHGEQVFFVGGDGNDTLIGSQGGGDRVFARGDLDFMLGATQLTGQGTDTLRDIDEALLQGGAGDNVLDASGFIGGLVTMEGMGGDDTLIGSAAGTDRVRASGDVDFRLTDTQLIGLGTDTLADIDEAQLTGDAGANTLDASAFTRGSVWLMGEAGNDILRGGAGNDVLSGGSGDDLLSGGDGSDRVSARADVDFILTDTRLTGIGTDTLTSIEEAHLTGGEGDNTLDASGFTGSLVIFEGGRGNDNLIGRGTGIDRVRAEGDVDFSLTDGVLTGLGSDTLTSIEQALLVGHAGSNVFDASAFTRGPVRILSGAGNDSVLGGSADDTLIAGYGDDRIIGGLGADNCSGGAGADVFVFASVADSGPAQAERDTVKDFRAEKGDRIDLSAIDADTATAGMQAFATLTEGGSFSGVFASQAELYFDQVAKILYGNVDGDAEADLAIFLPGVASLSLDAFVLA